MQAMRLERLGPVTAASEPLAPADLPTPAPGPDAVLVRVLACGVCRTELDQIEGRLPPPRLPVVPGHQVVGEIAALGSAVRDRAVGERVGVGWIHRSTGADDENLDPAFRATGHDADGGYAEFLVVPAAYAHPLPPGLDDAAAAPLLCAGAVGLRALRACALRDGEPLGLQGFGASAHLVLQMARHLYPRSAVHVFARDAGQRAFAARLGAVWTGASDARSPVPLAAIVDTTPAWAPVLAALSNLRPGGRLVVNAIRKEDADKTALLGLSYHEHLWRERRLQTIANVTGRDIRDCLQLAAAMQLRPTVAVDALRDANRVLRELHAGRQQGARVLVPGA